jgi:hypothetical protein
VDNDWSRWRQEKFGDPYMVWHDGPDFTVMLADARVEPETVVRMLRAGLVEGDSLAAQGFTELAAAGLAPPEAAALLTEEAASARGDLLIRVAQALFALTADPAWADRIVEVLEGDGSEFVRLDAAIALAGFPPSPSLTAAAARAVATDGDYLVRYHASNTLLKYAGHPADISSRPALFNQVAGEDPAGWRAAAEELTS